METSVTRKQSKLNYSIVTCCIISILSYLAIDIQLASGPNIIALNQTDYQWYYYIHCYILITNALSSLFNINPLFTMPTSSKYYLIVIISNIFLLFSLHLHSNHLTLSIMLFIGSIIILFYSIFLFIQTQSSSANISFFGNLIISYWIWSIINLSLLLNQTIFNNHIKHDFWVIFICWFILWTLEWYSYQFNICDILNFDNNLILPHILYIRLLLQYETIIESIFILFLCLSTISFKIYLISEPKNRFNAPLLSKISYYTFLTAFISCNQLLIYSAYTIYIELIPIMIDILHYGMSSETVRIRSYESRFIFIVHIIQSIVSLYTISRIYKVYILIYKNSQFHTMYDVQQMIKSLMSWLMQWAKVPFSIITVLLLNGNYCRFILICFYLPILLNCYYVYYQLLWKYGTVIRKQTDELRPNLYDWIIGLFISKVINLYGAVINNQYAHHIHEGISFLLLIQCVYQYHLVYIHRFKRCKYYIQSFLKCD